MRQLDGGWRRYGLAILQILAIQHHFALFAHDWSADNTGGLHARDYASRRRLQIAHLLLPIRGILAVGLALLHVQGRRLGHVQRRLLRAACDQALLLEVQLRLAKDQAGESRRRQ